MPEETVGPVMCILPVNICVVWIDVCRMYRSENEECNKYLYVSLKETVQIGVEEKGSKPLCQV